MTIDTGALVEPLAYAICAEQDRRCACAEIPADYRLPCEDAERSARAAIAYLLPLIVERCAEVAGKHTPKDDEWNDSSSSGCRAFLEGCKFTAENTSKAIRALIQKEASDGFGNRALAPGRDCRP